MDSLFENTGRWNGRTALWWKWEADEAGDALRFPLRSNAVARGANRRATETCAYAGRDFDCLMSCGEGATV